MDAVLATAPPAPPAPHARFTARVSAALARRQAERARTLAQDFLTREPGSIEARLALACAAWLVQDWAEAAAQAQLACEGDAGAREAADLVAVCYGLAGDLSTCIYFAKLAAALPARPDLAALLPADLPPLPRVLCEIDEAALLQRSLQALGAGDIRDAEHWLEQRLAFFPGCADGHLQRALLVLAQGRARAAADALRAARQALPEQVEIAGLLARALTASGRFGEATALHRWCAKRAPDDPVLAAAALTDRLADPDAEPCALAAGFRAWGERHGVAAEPRHADGLAAAPDRQRLTIGLLIAGEAAGAAQQALADALLHRDAPRYAVIGFGCGRLDAGPGAVFQNALDRWRDVTDADPLTLGAMVRAENIDLLVDVAGFAAPGLLSGLAARLAPCQAAWLNAPYGTGLAAVDFLLTDGFVDPHPGTEAAGVSLRERLIHLERGCLPLRLAAPADPPAGPIADLSAGPAAELTFAADATLADLTAGTIAAWAEVLRRVPGAMLLLRDHDFRDPETAAELITRLGNFGIAGRVDLLSVPDAARLFAEADVALLPFAQPRGETVAAALQAGIPLVCPVGSGRHQRLAGSVLHHLGLGEGTLASDPAAYVAAAVRWASSAGHRIAFRSNARERIAARTSAPAQMRDLENAFNRMWQMRAALGR